MIIGPTFFSGNAFDEGVLTPGTPVPTAIAVSGTPVICKIDSTRGLIVYQRGGTFDLAAVVVSVSGGVPSAGTPALLSASIRTPLSVRPLGDGTQFVAFYRNSTNLFAQVFEVSGTTITTPNAEATSAALTSPNRGYGEVLSAASAGIVFEASDAGVTKVHGVAITIASGVCTFGTPAISDMRSMGGGGSRPVLRSGQLVQFGKDVASSPIYLASVGFDISGSTCTAGAVKMPTLTADRIRADATYGTGGTIDAGGGVVALLYQDFGTGSVASVRGAWSGTDATYSNSDANKNILPGSPYAPPTTIEVQGYGQVSPSGSYGTLFTSPSGAVKMYPIGISGTVNMAGNGVVLVASGASNIRPGHVYLSATEILYCYVISSGVLLGLGTCGVG